MIQDLCRFSASAPVSGGAGVKQVRLVLGRASAVSALRICAHLWPGEEARTRTVTDTVLGGLRSGCGRVDQAIGEIAGHSA
ncbi:integrase [Streptomyces prasinopilosus]|uniref:Uncharacterized protein n=1 Tax=Streptomyces prasinopilosus TaxID=67344 RepID=A0A1G6WFK5_9ACTN|nr:integrase [Streptomyces prasinopilosus]SDD64588.1 hypothetical protein SAMN05216505_11072 [Streptomyces prasinopilosus]